MQIKKIIAILMKSIKLLRKYTQIPIKYCFILGGTGTYTILLSKIIILLFTFFFNQTRDNTE